MSDPLEREYDRLMAESHQRSRILEDLLKSSKLIEDALALTRENYEAIGLLMASRNKGVWELDVDQIERVLIAIRFLAGLSEHAPKGDL